MHRRTYPPQTYAPANVNRLWSLFEKELFSVEAPARQFNPYAARHAALGRTGGARDAPQETFGAA